MKAKLYTHVYGSMCLLLLTSLGWGQEIRGQVTDPSGALVRNAEVQLKSGKNVVASTSTNREGNYAIHRHGGCAACRIEITAAGFATTSREVTVKPEESLVLPIRLEIAVASASVSVEAKEQPFGDQLDMSEVRESPAKDVGEALAEVDGVYKIRKGGIANDIVVRGFQQNNVAVLIDGARIYGACPGHMDPAVEHADFAEVERVEVVKGAFDVENSGGLGATVNVVTKAPPLGVHVTPSFSTGSFGFYNPSLTASAGNRQVRVLVGYSYRVSDPYKDGAGKTFLSDTNFSAMAMGKHAFDIHTGWMETEVAPTEHQKVSLAYTRQQSGLVLYPYETMDSDYDNADRATLKYELREVGTLIRSVHAQAYFTQVIHFMSDRYRTSAGMNSWMMAANARARVAGGQIAAEAGRGFTFGVDGYHRNWTMMGYMNMMGMLTSNPSLPNVDTNTLGSYAGFHHAFGERLKVTAGLRFDHDSMSTGVADLNTDAYYNYQGTRQSRAEDDYASGNARVSYVLPHAVELFAGVGSNGRIPDAEERFINRASMSAVNVGDPNLPIVRNTESTAGAIYRKGSNYVKSTLFFSQVSDYILVNNQPLLTMAMAPRIARSYTNVNAHLYGGEMSYAFALPRAFSLTGGASYSIGTNERKAIAGVLSSSLPEMPPLRTWAALRYVHRYFFAELGGVGVARQKRVDSDLQETPTAGYGVLNLKAGATYHRLNASFMVDNLLNHFYYEHLSYYRDPFSSGVKVPEPGRNVFAQVKYSF